MITPRTTDSDGAEATASRHITILPLSPGNRISRLQLETLDAYDFRRGTNGEMQSLLNLLTTAREQIPRGNVRAAINQLEAYIHRIRRISRHQHPAITVEAALPPLDEAHAIILRTADVGWDAADPSRFGRGRSLAAARAIHEGWPAMHHGAGRCLASDCSD